jgi:hypothetical protein
MKKAFVVLAAMLVLAGGLGFLVSGNSSSDSGDGSGVAAEVPGGPAIALSQPPLTEDAAKLAGSGAADEPAEAAVVSGSTSEMALPPGGVGPRIIKSTDMTIEVDEGGFDDAFGRADLIVGKYGGFVVSSSTWGEKSRSGTMLIRVPSKNFALAKDELSRLGEIKSESTSGQEVTDQFVDLNARLRTWQAQANVLMKLMSEADSISETMTVQRELQQVQFQIEQIKGQLRVLRDQTSYATIALEVHEPGVVAATPAGDKPSLSAAWDQALEGFLTILSLVIVGLGYLIPLALVAAVAWFVVRRLTAGTAKTEVV